MSHIFIVARICLGFAFLLSICGCIRNQSIPAASDRTEHRDGRRPELETLSSEHNDSVNRMPVKSQENAAESRSDPVSEAYSFDALVAGLEHCKFDRWYIDPPGLQPAHPYFIQRKLQACKVDEVAEIAYFCVSENFRGLHVSMVEMQSSTAATSRGIHLDVPLETARQILRKQTGSEFRKSAQSENAEAPILMPDPTDREKSMLICVYPYGY